MNLHAKDIVVFLEDIGETKGNDDLDFDIAEKAIYDRFGISFDLFYDIMNFLIDYTPIIKSQFTGKRHRGFVNKEDTMFLIKKEV
jgi:hypothetical protein